MSQETKPEEAQAKPEPYHGNKWYHIKEPALDDDDYAFMIMGLGKDPDNYNCGTATNYSNNLNRAYDLWTYIRAPGRHGKVGKKWHGLSELCLYFRLRNILSYISVRVRNNYGYMPEQIKEFKDDVCIKQLRLFKKYPGKYVGSSWIHYLKTVWKTELHYHYNAIRPRSQHIVNASSIAKSDGDSMNIEDWVTSPYDNSFTEDIVFANEITKMAADMINDFDFPGDEIDQGIYRRIVVNYISTGEFRFIHQLGWIPQKIRFRMVALAVLVHERISREFGASNER